MTHQLSHPLLQTYKGTGFLSVPESKMPEVPVELVLDAESLQITVAVLSKFSFLSEAAQSEGSTPLLQLRGELRGDAAQIPNMQLYAQCFVLKSCSEDWSEEFELATTLVVLPQQRCLTLFAEKNFQNDRAFEVVYRASSDVGLDRYTLEHLQGAQALTFKHSRSAAMLHVFSNDDFFGRENRLHAALSLLQGCDLVRVLEVEGNTLRLYGGVDSPTSAHFPMVRTGGSKLALAVLQAFWDLENSEFERIKVPLKMYVASKQLHSYVEVSWLMAMVSVEAMDRVDSLKEPSTQAMLNVNAGTAILINAMRHKLLHGVGGYEAAFEQVLQEQLKGWKSGKMKEVQEYVVGDHSQNPQLKFMTLLYRLWERMDAFWCACVRVPSDVINYGRHASVSLMESIDWDVFLKESAKAQQSIESNKAQRPKQKKIVSGQQVQIVLLTEQLHALIAHRDALQSELDQLRGK